MSVIEKLDTAMRLLQDTESDWGEFYAAAINLLRDHGPAIRQAMIDAERLDWISDLDNAMEIGIYGVIGPDLRQRIDKARATGEGEGHE